MGCGYSFTCKDCKVTYDLGYSSYGSWLYAETVEEFLNHQDKTAKKSYVSENLLFCLMQHQGHDYELWHHDYFYVEDGNVIDSHYDHILIENVIDFAEIDMAVVAVREKLFNEAGFDPGEWRKQQEKRQ